MLGKRLGTLALGALMLANLAVEAAKLVPPAQAATSKMQYKIVAYDERNREAVLNDMAAQGWEFVAIEPRYGGYIFERE